MGRTHTPSASQTRWRSGVEHIRQSLQAQAPFVTVTMTDALRHLITEASASAVWPEGKSSRLTKIAGEDKSSSKGRKSRGKP